VFEEDLAETADRLLEKVLGATLHARSMPLPHGRAQYLTRATRADSSLPGRDPALISWAPMNRSSRMPVLLLLVVLTGACVLRRERPDARRSGPRVSDSESSAQLDGLVNDVCTKSVVLLGEEGHHAGGHTVEVKSELVKRLIERCRFNAVYFESSAYEFYDLNRRLAAGTSAREQVADAIGGLWSTSNAIDPLVGYLYTHASTGRIRLAGLDPQLGTATCSYEKAALADELLQGLDGPRRSTCAAEILRRTLWTYDAEHPYDDAARASLAECFREAGNAAPPDSFFSVAAQATQAVLTNPAADREWDTRERQMARLFRWNQQRSPGASRVVVWTANVHAARSSGSLKTAARPLGEELRAEYGDRLASIAFTSLGGAYGRRDSTPVPAAGPESLEARALAGGVKEVRYLPRSALAGLGAVDASLFSYDKVSRADWSLLFDGAVVLREERPLGSHYPPKPRFVPRA